LEPELTSPDLHLEPSQRVLTGLIGRDILASRSPWLHEKEADAQGLRLLYTLLDFSARGWKDTALPEVLDSAQHLGFAGVNVTFPFKQAILPYLDALSPGAQRIGAVNTVSFADGKRTGFNTDVTGFSESFTQSLPDAALTCAVQLGAGGAGSATAQALLESGVQRLIIFDSEPQKCLALVKKLKAEFGTSRAAAGDDLARAARIADGILNATPVGMTKLPGLPLPAALIEPRHWVADIVYFPLETELLREAKQRGCRTLNGSGMAIHQAAGAFEIFTGLQPDRERMQKSFVDFVSGPVVQAA
jgi:shikimate dehydrogenase